VVTEGFVANPVLENVYIEYNRIIHGTGANDACGIQIAGISPTFTPGVGLQPEIPANNIWIRSNSITGFGELVNSSATAGAITVINSTAATIVRPTSGDVVGDYRWLPNGMKVIIGGAGAQGSDLRARVLANNGSELTLDTSAATQQAAASLTYQPLSLS
jgi:hypothetical protein